MAAPAAVDRRPYCPLTFLISVRGHELCGRTHAHIEIELKLLAGWQAFSVLIHVFRVIFNEY